MTYETNRFVLAYPQADIEIPLYIEIPAGIKVKNKTRKQKIKIKKESILTKVSWKSLAPSSYVKIEKT